jgi:hypothetical protein
MLPSPRWDGGRRVSERQAGESQVEKEELR